MKKIPVFYMVMGILAALCLLVSLLIPETGRLALLNEVCTVALMLVLGSCLAGSLVPLFRTRKIPGAIAVLALVAVIGWVGIATAADTVKDVAAGPEYVTLSNCRLERRSSAKGLSSLQYYLEGDAADGKEYRLRISGLDYDRLKGKENITILCYPNTGRIVDWMR